MYNTLQLQWILHFFQQNRQQGSTTRLSKIAGFIVFPDRQGVKWFRKTFPASPAVAICPETNPDGLESMPVFLDNHTVLVAMQHAIDYIGGLQKKYREDIKAMSLTLEQTTEQLNKLLDLCNAKDRQIKYLQEQISMSEQKLKEQQEAITTNKYQQQTSVAPPQEEKNFTYIITPGDGKAILEALYDVSFATRGPKNIEIQCSLDVAKWITEAASKPISASLMPVGSTMASTAEIHLYGFLFKLSILNKYPENKPYLITKTIPITFKFKQS